MIIITRKAATKDDTLPFPPLTMLIVEIPNIAPDMLAPKNPAKMLDTPVKFKKNVTLRI